MGSVLRCWRVLGASLYTFACFLQGTDYDVFHLSSKLRLVSRKRILLEGAPKRNMSTIKHQGIGDVLLPYHALQRLEIDWHVLPLGDPRLRAMEDCANAVPVMKFDLRCSRACTLSTVGDLHVSLGSGKTPMDTPRAELMGQQLDLIFQQFDLPALRTVHFSHDFTGDMDMLVGQWKKLLPTIRLQYWPYLEAVQICVAAPYHFSTPENPVEGYDPTQVMIWVSPHIFGISIPANSHPPNTASSCQGDRHPHGYV